MCGFKIGSSADCKSIRIGSEIVLKSVLVIFGFLPKGVFKECHISRKLKQIEYRMKALLKALEKTVVLVLYTANYLKKRRFYDNFLSKFGPFRTLTTFVRRRVQRTRCIWETKRARTSHESSPKSP